MIQTIVVAVDGSPAADKALAFAAELASKYEARMVLVHALLRKARLDSLKAIAERMGFSESIEADLENGAASSWLAEGTGELGSSPLVPEEILRKVGTLILETSKASIVGLGLEVETVLETGRSASAILGCVDEQKADLLVIGSRGLGSVRGLLLGSVSQRLAQDAPCACLIVK